MNDKKNLVSTIGQSGLKWVAVIILLAAFVCAIWVNFGIRMQVEAKDRTVGLVIDYDELKRIADASYEIEFSDMLRKAHLAGATGLVVRERLLAEWEIAGDIIVYSGGQLMFQLENIHGASATEMIAGMGIKPNKTYILTKDALVYEQLYSLLDAKRRHPEPFDYPGYMGIATNLHSSERATLGMGFPLAQLEQAAAEGFQIIPRLRNWEPISRHNLEVVFSWVNKIPNLAAIGFNDQSVPGDVLDTLIMDYIADAIKPLGKPLVSFEFYDQTGFISIASRMDTNILRVHAIGENEVYKYLDFNAAMNRYSLAATERNIRYIYVRFQGLIDPAASMLDNMELIEGVRDGLIDERLIVGDPTPLSDFNIPLPILFMLGAGVIAAGGWLLAMAAKSFFTKRIWTLLFILLMVLGLAAWAAGLVYVQILARKLFALAGAIFFPTLSAVIILRLDLPKATGIKAMFFAIAKLLAMSAMTLVGAMIMSALLADPMFMLKSDGMFSGVKAAHIIPLAIVPLILWLREQDLFGLLSGQVKSNVKFWQLGVFIALFAGVAVYILRTGNDNLEVVSDLELQARQMLNNWLGVRPRTTEFLIGHPLMLVLLYYGYKFNMFPVLMIGFMGQVSLVNTYAHIHTPLAVSLRRSTHGLWGGIVIGIIIIIALELILNRVRIINARRASAKVS